MSLLKLPFELQFLILNHIKSDNHLDLAPLAQSCTYYFSLVSDRFNWANTVTIGSNGIDGQQQYSSMETTTTTRNSKDISHRYLMHALLQHNHNKYKFNTKKLQAVIMTATTDSKNTTSDALLNLLYIILQKQTNLYCIQDINLMIPTSAHHYIYQTLAQYPQNQLDQIVIRDPTDDNYIMSTNSHDMLSKFLTVSLSNSQNSLQIIHMPSFPSDLLVSKQLYQFKHVYSLQIALTCGEIRTEAADPTHYWRQFKSVFPNLQELTLTLSKESIPLFKALLMDISLFPWIKRLFVNSVESPKAYLSREELRAGLLRLHGLNRITAGWDMIAIN